MYLVFVDYFGEVVSSSNNDVVTFEVSASQSDYAPRYDAGSSLWSAKGVFNLTEVVFIGEPDSDISLKIQSSYIDGTLE